MWTTFLSPSFSFAVPSSAIVNQSTKKKKTQVRNRKKNSSIFYSSLFLIIQWILCLCDTVRATIAHWLLLGFTMLLPSSQHQYHRTLLRCLRLRNREIAPSFEAINSRISHSNVHCCLPASVACTSPLSDEKLNKHYSATPLLFGDSISLFELYYCCETRRSWSMWRFLCVGVSLMHIVTRFGCDSKMQQTEARIWPTLIRVSVLLYISPT